MFSVRISTGPSGSFDLSISDAEDFCLYFVTELFRLEIERRVRELEAMSDERLFAAPEAD